MNELTTIQPYLPYNIMYIINKNYISVRMVDKTNNNYFISYVIVDNNFVSLF